MRVAVIGSGPGGYVAALKCAQLGADVTVIEKDAVGGTCLNWGCIPTKTFAASAAALRTARDLEKFGIDSTGSFSPNMTRMADRKNKVVQVLGKGILSLFRSWGVTFMKGKGRLRDRHTVIVEGGDQTREITDCDRIILATGSRPAELPLFRFDGDSVLSSNDILDIVAIPQSLVIIGAGVIGCEFACMFREFGTQVTMIEMLDRPVATEDHEISELLTREFKKRKITLKTGARITNTDILPDGVRIGLEDGTSIRAEKVLVSVGRALNTDNIGLEALGIERGSRGQIAVNDRMQTSVDGIYAVGDSVGGMLLAHVASRQGIIAAVNACTGADKRMDYDVVPAGIFTSPEIGSVGLREFQARERGISVRIGRFPFRALGKAHAVGEIEGFVKTVADAGTGKVLGVHIIGPHATDLIHEASLAIHAGLSSDRLADMIHAHPTLSEALQESAEDVMGTAVHVQQKQASL